MTRVGPKRDGEEKGMPMPGRAFRKESACRWVACLTILLGTTGAKAQQSTSEQGEYGGKAVAVEILPEVEAVIEENLAWLSSRQQQDGTFVEPGDLYADEPAIVALCGLAFLAGGSLPEEGPYGEEVSRAVDYLLRSCRENGLIAPEQDPNTQRGPMYGHGFATLFLSECCGSSDRTDLQPKLERAVRLILRVQNEEGGWRYEPVRGIAADISVTVCQVMALRAAKNAGIAVPSESIDRAMDYVKRCQNPDGGFMYMLPDGPSAFPRTAAAIVAMQSGGLYEGEEIEAAIEYLRRYLQRNDSTRAGDDSSPLEVSGYYYYGKYYAALALWQRGGELGHRSYRRLVETLLNERREDRRWHSPYSREYATAMACIVLQIPYHYLPIAQR